MIENARISKRQTERVQVFGKLSYAEYWPATYSKWSVTHAFRKIKSIGNCYVKKRA